MRWLIPALFLALAAPAFAQDGTASLNFGKGTIRVKPGCGKNRQPLFGTWVFSGGSWTATTTGNPVLEGTSVARRSSRRAFALAFDGPSKLLFDDALESWASAVCGIPVTLQRPPGTTLSRFSLKLNKRSTRAKVRLAARGTGTSSAGSGTGTYKAVVRGSWTAAAQ